MNTNLLLNNLNYNYDYKNLIVLGLTLGCTISYLIITNCTANSSKNMEALTNEEIETIINEITVPVSNANIDAFITDSDFDTEVESDNTS
jgi:ribosomal protein S13